MLEAFRDFERFGGNSEQEWLAWLKRILAHNAADFIRRYRGTAKRQARREVPIRGPQDSTLAPARPNRRPPALPQPGVPADRRRASRNRRAGRAAGRLPGSDRACGTFSDCLSTKWPSGWSAPALPCKCSGCGRLRSCKRRWRKQNPNDRVDGVRFVPLESSLVGAPNRPTVVRQQLELG